MNPTSDQTQTPITIRKEKINQEAKARLVNDQYVIDLLADLMMARHTNPGVITKLCKEAEKKCRTKKDRMTFKRIRKCPNPVVMLDSIWRDLSPLMDEVANRYVYPDPTPPDTDTDTDTATSNPDPRK